MIYFKCGSDSKCEFGTLFSFETPCVTCTRNYTRKNPTDNYKPKQEDNP